MRTVRKPDERGASGVEYGLLVAGIAAVVAVVVFSLGRVSGDKLGSDCTAIGGAIATSVQSTSTPCHP